MFELFEKTVQEGSVDRNVDVPRKAQIDNVVNWIVTLRWLIYHSDMMAYISIDLTKPAVRDIQRHLPGQGILRLSHTLTELLTKSKNNWRASMGIRWVGRLIELFDVDVLAKFPMSEAI